MADAGLVALCDIQKGRVEEILSEYRDISGRSCGDVRICTDWADIVDSEAEIVHICTPHHLHVPMAAALLNAGKAVFMEKPCAVSRRQFEELKQADRANPGKLGICFQNRYNTTTKELARAIAEGKIGRVTGGRAFVTWRRDAAYYRESDWKGSIETEGGGALINQSIHTLDLLLGFLGKPVKLSGSIADHHLKSEIEVEDTVEAWFETEDGKRGCFYGSTGYCADAPVILEIQGDRGRIMLCGNEVILSTEDGVRHITKASGGGMIKDYCGDGHRACIRDFYHCIAEGRNPVTDLKSAEVVTETVLKIYEGRTGFA